LETETISGAIAVTMTQTFTRQNLDELFYQAHDSNFAGNGGDIPSEIEFLWPVEIALGRNRILPLRPGLQVWCETLTPPIDLHLTAHYQASDPFGLIFVLAGDFQSTLFRGKQTLNSQTLPILLPETTSRAIVCPWPLSSPTTELFNIVAPLAYWGGLSYRARALLPLMKRIISARMLMRW